MSVASLATTSVTIHRRGAASGAAQTRTLSLIYAGKARIQPLSSKETQQHGRDLGVVMAKAYISGTVGAEASDVLRETASGKEWIVRGVRDIDRLGRFTTLELEEQR